MFCILQAAPCFECVGRVPVGSIQVAFGLWANLCGDGSK